MTQSNRLYAAHPQPLPRLDVAEIAQARQHHTLVEILERHGIAVAGSGPRRMARCPFHNDQSPSLSVYLDSNRYYCFACGASGDAISLVQRLEGLDFREAVVRLNQNAETSVSPNAEPCADVTPRGTTPSADAQETRFQIPAEEVAPPVQAHAALHAMDLLTVATALYQSALAASQEARAYLRARGVTAETARRMHVGYGRPGTLHDFLGDDPTLVAQAREIGLLDAFGKERLAGRIIIPELRNGRCLWLVGRTLPQQDAHGSPTGPEHPLRTVSPHAETPKYLGVTASKPLMGIGFLRRDEPTSHRAARTSGSASVQTSLGSSGVIVVEGPFDLLAAQQWRLPLPCVALIGSQASQRQLAELIALTAGSPIWLALDADAAGDAGAESLRSALMVARYAGPIYRLRPPLDAKDFGELAGVAGARMAVVRLLTHPAASETHLAPPTSVRAAYLDKRRNAEATP